MHRYNGTKTAALNRKIDWCSRFSACQPRHLTSCMARNFMISCVVRLATIDRELRLQGLFVKRINGGTPYPAALQQGNTIICVLLPDPTAEGCFCPHLAITDG